MTKTQKRRAALKEAFDKCVGQHASRAALARSMAILLDGNLSRVRAVEAWLYRLPGPHAKRVSRYVAPTPVYMTCATGRHSPFKAPAWTWRKGEILCPKCRKYEYDKRVREARQEARLLSR